jgi:chromosomal replication initiator protein
MIPQNPIEVAALVLRRAERRLSLIHGRAVQLVPIIDVEGVTPEYVKRTVSFVTGVPEEAMKSKSRKREIVEARQIAMDLIKEEFDHISLKDIGLMFGGRYHSTVIHSITTVADLNHSSKDFSKKYENCRRRIQFLKINGIKREPLLLPAAREHTL